MTKKLDVLANLAIIVTCLLAIGIMLSKAGMLPAERFFSDKPQTGDSLPALWRVKSGNAAPAVVAVLRSTCGFCTESMPLYRELTRIRRNRAGTAVPFIVVSNESPETITKYLSSHGVTASRIVTVPTAAMGAPGTPTLFVVDDDGRIVIREVGRLSDTKGRALVAKVASL